MSPLSLSCSEEVPSTQQQGSPLTPPNPVALPHLHQHHHSRPSCSFSLFFFFFFPTFFFPLLLIRDEARQEVSRRRSGRKRGGGSSVGKGVSHTGWTVRRERRADGSAARKRARTRLRFPRISDISLIILQQHTPTSPVLHTE